MSRKESRKESKEMRLDQKQQSHIQKRATKSA